MSTFGQLFLASMVQSGDLAAFTNAGDIGEFFKPTDLPAFEYVRQHVKLYHTLPTFTAIKFNTGQDLAIHKAKAEDDPAYYLDLMRTDHLGVTLKKALHEAGEHLAPDGNPHEALALLLQAAIKLQHRQQVHAVADFRESHDPLMADYVAAYANEDYGLRLGWETMDKMSGGLHKGDVYSMVGRPAAGKALADGTPVLLANGRFKPVEALAVGDDLASIDGAPSEVFGVYPQGDRALFRVLFSDGRHLDVDGDHLWQVGCKYWPSHRILTTRELLALRERSRYQASLYVPTHAGEHGGKMPFMDPYTLGVLIGDGCLTGKSPSFTTMDPEVLARVMVNLVRGLSVVAWKTSNAGRATSYSLVGPPLSNAVNVIHDALRRRGLTCLSSHKRLPDEVFAWSRADRVALLQGLMDTDGTVDRRHGGVTFSSSSKALAQGVQGLVRSLGGKARLGAPKRTTGLDHHFVSVTLRDRAEAFSLTRKRALCRAYATHDPARLHIAGIEPLTVGKATCIAVTHPSRLFVAGDYVVTHNTWQLLYAAMHGWLASKPKNGDPYGDPVPGGTRMFVSMEMSILEVRKRMAAVVAQLPVKHLYNTNFSGTQLAGYKDALLSVKGFGNPFWIVDGNLKATVEDIWALALQLKPDAIFIDGGYLLKHATETDRYRRVAENADLIKTSLAPIAPTCVTWQFAKSAVQKSNKKQSSENAVGLEDIGYSAAIGEVSSLVTGLFQPDDVETVHRRVVRIIKGRKGEVGQFECKWDFERMDFGELHEPDMSEVAFA